MKLGYTSVLFGLCLLALAAAGHFFFQSEKYNERSPQFSPDLSLNGIWKINYSDKPEFASFVLDDSNWCETAVPHPSAGNPTISADCPEYQAAANSKMQGNTYWYRKTFEIKDERWNEPSFFFGAIKHVAQVYLNGVQVHSSTSRIGDGLTYFPIEERWLRNGKNVVAIRVTSATTNYPGIFHLHERGVAIGELSKIQTAFKAVIDHKFVWPLINLFIQLSALFFVTAMLLLAKKISPELIWLSLFFCLSAGSSLVTAMIWSNLNHFLFYTLPGLSGLAVAGFTVAVQVRKSEIRRSLFQVIGGGMAVIMATYLFSFAFHSFSSPAVTSLRIAVALFPLVTFFYFELERKVTLLFPRELLTKRYSSDQYFVTAGLFGTHIAGGLPFFVDASRISIVSDSPLFRAFLTVGLLFSLLVQFLRQERELAFFGRFIRPGLKDLLSVANSTYDIGEDKFFRPRKIALLKVDIVNHTQATTGLPYGAKRLFQDIWFSTIDSLLADRIFLDKNVGDGSIYCLRENHPDGPCGSALVAAELILDKAIRQFDVEFRTRLAQLYEVTPEFREPMNRFSARYRQATGKNFEDLRTEVRIGLAYGFVDEGLWGSREQSHYDVQGDLVSLVARIEASARPGEIVADRQFFEQLVMENSEFSLIGEARKIHPKGIGPLEVYSLSREKLKRFVS
jgi:class 3 adenylate cyclase